ncbi:hypothetical protein [Cellulomonas xylanilytica]|uniref:Lipoprotein n=1 Tax=Cellulomonas xylanilytica TaxID=233583 RepID=A0A510V4M4_9CELL|nr:hypothetical protein [Cellulomonas xylanilytica]GEK21756.1 hypothetical protein CXY01_22760 [Cellulomonas xylanilytica]
MPVRLRAALVLLVALVLVGGCASRAARSGAADPSASVTPTAACPIYEGQEMPDDCVPYDGEAMMAQNDAYRQRFEPTDESRTEVEPQRAAAQAALATLVGGPLSVDAVRDALEAAGFDRDAPWVEAAGDPAAASSIGVIISVGGLCLVGTLDGEHAEVETDGMIADGGCVPAQ